MPGAALQLERPPLDRGTVERFGLQGEPGWLREARAAAAERYAAAPWPRTDLGEEWRRFPIAELPLDLVEAAAAHAPPVTVRIAAADAARGVVASDLRTAAREHPDLVADYLGRHGGVASHDALRALCEALWTNGAFVHAPPGLTLEGPIELTIGAGLTRTLVVAGRGSAFTLVEDQVSADGAPRLAIPVLDVFLEDGAQVEYVQLQRFAPDTWNLGSQRYHSERDSRLASYTVMVGGGRSKIGVGSDIVGDNASVRLYGLLAGADDQRVDLNTFQDLNASHSESLLLYLAALYDRAKAVYYGVIRVEPGTRATSSFQECRAMLLSENAGAAPIPVLEILANDVARCGHAAAAGALDLTELFYVMSRGLPRKQAETLLVRGFFEKVIGNVRAAEVRWRMLAALVPRIGSVAELDDPAPTPLPSAASNAASPSTSGQQRGSPGESAS